MNFHASVYHKSKSKALCRQRQENGSDHLQRGEKKKTLERWGEQAAGAWVSTGLTLILMWSWCGEFNEWQSIIMCSLVWCAFLHPPSLGLSRTTWRMCGRKRRSGGHDRLKNMYNVKKSDNIKYCLTSLHYTFVNFCSVSSWVMM